MFKEKFQAIGIHDSGIQEEYVLICMCGWYKIDMFVQKLKFRRKP